MMAWISFQIYRWFFIPISLLFLNLLRPFLSGKLRQILDERRTLQWPAMMARPIWVHAASGEIEYAKPLIRAIKASYPQIPILVTYFSPSAKKLIKDFPGVDFIIPSPWDSKKNVQSYLKKFNPVLILYARTDIWPELATAAHEKNIPQLLFAATLDSQSSRLKFPMSFLSQWTMGQLDLIHCVSQEDATEFKSLIDENKIQVAGDTRYDQVQFRLEHPKKINLKLHEKGPIFIAGSTWPSDEEKFLPSLKIWQKNGGSIIIAPHEIHGARLDELSKKLNQHGYPVERYSQIQNWNKNSILLIDEIGILQEVYSFGNLAFVGGSFKDKVHSVMEPLACGLPVMVGPFHTNNREALQFQNFRFSSSLAAVEVVLNSADFERVFSLYAQVDSATQRKTLQSKVKSLTGASQSALAFVSAKLGPSAKS